LPLVLPPLDAALKNLAAGYLEFSFPIKINFYRQSRESLAHLYVQLLTLCSESSLLEAGTKIPEDENSWAVSASHTVMNRILPGLSGTLRKLERGGNRKTKSENHDDET
jgi:hypothetical protein